MVMTAAGLAGRRVVVLAGPTAVGKSALALRLCEVLSGELVSVDSVQVYRGLEIGANKPTADEMRRVPHHLVDVRDPLDEYTAGAFYVDALRAIEQVLSRGKNPDLRDQNKRTPVHLAASEGQMAALRFLVEEARCDVNPIDGRQHTPLDDATREHRTEAAAYLREMGGKSQRAIAKPSDGRFSREFAKVASP